MPFRGIRAEVSFGEPQCIVTAQAGDIEVQISCGAYGATGVSAGPNFVVGGPGIADEGGLFVTSNECTTAVEEGDEVWVAAAEELPYTGSIVITGFVRSSRKPADSEARRPAAETGPLVT